MRVVPASHGLRWLREGLEILAAAPATWVGITVLFLLIGVALSVVPLAGMLWSVAVPIHAGGLMLGCDALRRGQPLEVRHLFNGFEQPRLSPLALVGALYLAGTLLVMLPGVAFFVLGVFTTAGVGALSPALVPVAVTALGGTVVLMAAAAVALSMAIWFAPALVVFHDVHGLDALKLSLQAAWYNLGALLIFGLSMLSLAALAASPMVAAIVVLAMRGEDQAGPVAMLLLGGAGLFMLVWLLLFMPAAWGAMYASYRDVFGDPPP